MAGGGREVVGIINADSWGKDLLEEKQELVSLRRSKMERIRQVLGKQNAAAAVAEQSCHHYGEEALLR